MNHVSAGVSDHPFFRFTDWLRIGKVCINGNSDVKITQTQSDCGSHFLNKSNAKRTAAVESVHVIARFVHKI